MNTGARFGRDVLTAACRREGAVTRRAPACTSAARRFAFRDLLPTADDRPARSVLLGADADMVESVRSMRLLADDVTDRLGQPDSAGLIAVLADAERPSWTDVARELAPGGVLWWETDRRRRDDHWSTIPRVVRRLEAVGLVVVDVYVVRPEPDRAEWYVPLGHRDALRWFVGHLYAPSTVWQVGAEAAVRAAASLGPRAVSSLAPFHAVVARRSREAAAAPRAPAHPVRNALIGHGGQCNVVLGFRSEGRTPFRVMKIARDADGGESLAVEGRMADAARRHVGEPTASSIPRQLPGPPTSRPTLVQQAMPGASLARASSSPVRSFETKVRDLDAVVRWVGDLHESAVDDRHRWDDDSIAVIDGILDDFIDRFPTPATVHMLFDRTRRAAEGLWGRHVPTVWEHGDLTPWNVLIDGDEVRVVDWERARHGLPLADVLRLVDHWHAAVLGMTSPDHRATARGWIVRPPGRCTAATRAARRAIDGYVLRLGLPAELEDVLHVTCLADLAVLHDERWGGDDGTSRPNIPSLQIGHLARLLGAADSEPAGDRRRLAGSDDRGANG